MLKKVFAQTTIRLVTREFINAPGEYFPILEDFGVNLQLAR